MSEFKLKSVYKSARRQKVCKYCGQPHRPGQMFQCMKCQILCCAAMVGRNMKGEYVHTGVGCGGVCLKVDLNPLSKINLEKSYGG